jgi:hypothetical protein
MAQSLEHRFYSLCAVVVPRLFMMRPLDVYKTLKPLNLQNRPKCDLEI